MYVLGISAYYHDSSAALLKNGKFVAAAEEERFTRKKHDNSFPRNAITYCLNHAGIKAEDVDYVCFYEKPLLKFERLMSQHIQMFPRSIKTFLASTPTWITEKLRVVKTLKKMGFGDVMFVEHHMAHAASAFLLSPFEKAAIVTVDGVGEWTTTAIGYGKGNDIKLHKEIRFPHSLGLLYSTITAFLGFRVNNSEYKVMGLAAYGNPDKYYDRLKKVIDVKEDGSFRLKMDYFVFHYKDRMPSKKMIELLGPQRKPDTELTQRHKNIAAALQKLTEEVLLGILNQAYKETKCNNVVYSGGVALNSVFNGKILKLTPFRNVWIQPNALDGGTSMGAAAFVYNALLGKERRRLEHAYLGPGFSDKKIREFLDKKKAKYTILFEKELISKTAELIYENKIIGWFQGRMEWGPRALGARSILANPLNPEMQDILNKQVKHRESFRPFAPVVCAEDAAKYFECDDPLPEPAEYMLMVYPIKKNYQKKIPSVTHIDGTGRLQVIRRKTNPLYYNLVKEFGKISGTPILVNTSFNVKGEPIVCTPDDAYNCFMKTGIDYLVIGNQLVEK